jgi:hypothetical protein
MNLQWKPVVHGLVILLASSTAQAAKIFTDMRFDGRLGTEHFHWADLDHLDNVIGKEEGTRSSVNISYANHYRPTSGVILGAALNFSSGDLTYAGDAWSGVQVPPSQVANTQADSDSSQFGFGLQGGYRYVSGMAGFNLLGGVQHDTWQRDISDGVSTTGDLTYGHNESLGLLSFRLSAGVDYTSSRMQFALALGPMFSGGSRSVHLHAPTSDDDFSEDIRFLHAYFATLSAGLTLDDAGRHRTTLGVYWNEFRTKASRTTYVSPRGTAYLQPGAELSTLGVQIGYSYRF